MELVIELFSLSMVVIHNAIGLFSFAEIWESFQTAYSALLDARLMQRCY